MNLMFTGGGGPGNEAIYRLWKDQYNLYFADADLVSIHPDIPRNVCSEIPIATSPNFFNELLQIVKNLKIDILIPGVDEELLVAKKLEVSVPGLKVLLPDGGYIKTMLDKLSSFDKLSKNNFDVPWTKTADLADNIKFPCIVKPRRGRGSRGFEVINSYDQFDAYCILSEHKKSEIVVQERLVGEEFTVLMAANENKILHAVVPVKVEVKKGITIRGKTIECDKIIKFCESMHDILPASGCYNIQLILTQDGRVMPFEVNPRVSTTFCLGLAAGINPVEIYCSESKLENLLPFKSNIKLIRSWRNSFFDG